MTVRTGCLVIAALVAAWAVMVQAHGEPPPGSTPGPNSTWFRSLTVPDNGTPMAGAGCCSIADCRPVRTRIKNGHHEAFIDSQTFPDGHAPNAWVVVPDHVIIRNMANPVGEAVVCWYNKEVRCFVDASGA